VSLSNRLSCIVRRPLVLAIIAVALGLVPCGVVGLGIALVLAIPSCVAGEEQAKVRRALADIRGLDAAVAMYAIEHEGRAPGSIEDLLFLLNGRETGRVPADPWGTPYQLAPKMEHELLPGVRSLGSDGRLGGEGWAADLDSEDAREAPEAHQ
jgi:general secretion pathway protein G